ncbi:MAG TPA: CBS domain-containing protein [Anaerolineaceae bacterium]|nr:CBS domain-containing protein [Anaerolineaceae bacterium]
MNHRVKDWMSSPVIVIDQDSSVSYALTLMRRRNIRSLLISIDPDQNLYGILTSTDIRNKIIGKEQNPANVSVREIMTKDLVSASQDWTLKHCSIEMQKHNIQHMPVIDENNNLVGLISSTDLFFAAEEIGWEDNETKK